MSAVITDNQLILTATGTGFQAASGMLRTTPPASADMMVFMFRAYYDSYTSDENVNYGWGNPGCLGFSFSGDVPSAGDHSNFFGVGSNASETSDDVYYKYSSNAFGSGEAGLGFYPRNGSNAFSGSDSEDNPGSFTSDIEPNGPWDLPANPTSGAKFTGIWIVKKVINSRNILLSSGYNMESLSLEDIRNARTSENTVWHGTDTLIEESSNWRPSDSLIKMPEYVVFGFPSGIIGKKLIVDHFQIDWYSYNQLVASTE